VDEGEDEGQGCSASFSNLKEIIGTRKKATSGGVLCVEKVMRTILIIILILLLLGALPTWPYSTDWGYYPSGGLGLILLIVIILALMGRV
jgi:hypothetical protein